MSGSKYRKKAENKKYSRFDIVLCVILALVLISIIIPFFNVIAVSFTSQQEFLQTSILIFPKKPTLINYYDLFKDGRILIGLRTTVIILLIGLPLNLILTTSFAYGMSRKGFPGRKLIFYLVLFTMIFNGGVIPLYMLIKEMKLTNTIWSVILAYGINTFYMIIMRNYFSSLPESLIESAKLDGAGEWRILFSIVLPLSMPIIATVTLFYAVDRWNEWYYSMIFIRNAKLQPLQLILRNIVIDSQVRALAASSGAILEDYKFTNGLKMCAVIVTMLPVMCIFPFLQKHFVKGVLIGAIKS
ncbi:protein LplC [Thermoclostridium stercorarium subsp. stercorarium DSM 8532]|uniref:Protein LplC n=2 Tax=Thermoclostridium stercorarium TaxID=1510 RepID=L7VM69_THES1|nr:carbohydrate ABC transporter permease [Thermoclostridium stercorarium]AGC67842.1 protein LplC [Thermoclostridium stercorarium subsp. stercorarium DSM 8532]AGI38882.1 ABC transporter permease subunit [Thermoclostridium stercorarium subsp. stercorarium DSM 8532]ANW98251.1 ABC transporter permease [Thermoclostridium stercorarium subsp. thermolacticum DSM 2910]